MNAKSIKMPVPKDASVVKIAVEMADKVPQLISFNQKQPLATIILDLCSGWELTDPEQFALQFSENTNKKFITEKNRNDVKNGSVLKLTFSPSKTAHDILGKLNGSSLEEKKSALEQLSLLSTDITFAHEFINKQGLALLITMVEGGKYKGDVLAFTLSSFVELMDHGIVSWDILEVAFINKVAGFVNNLAPAQDTQVIEAALSILESIVLHSSVKYPLVEKEITIGNFLTHFQSPSLVIQQNALALVNALFYKADIHKKKTISMTLTSKQVRNVILSNIIQRANEVGTEMKHQLYVLQSSILGLLEARMNTKMDPQDQDAHEKIKELRRIAFDSDGGSAGDTVMRKQLGGFAKDYKKLGFKSDINPAMDFTETPPGVLALDAMVYFARNHVEQYTKVVLESSCRAEHECPFGRTSVEIVKLLCEILHIGDSTSELGTEDYLIMFFTHDHFFEELYSICIVLLNKTWKEMRANTEDFAKVLSVVKEQIMRAMAANPAGMELFRSELASLPYSKIMELRYQGRINRKELESHAQPIVQLKEMITPEILALIQRQRLHFLCDGSRFTKYSRGQRIKDKFWYARLSLNHKVLHYGDCDEKSAPLLEELPNKLAVIDIKALVTGKDCPHVKDNKGKKIPHNLAFSLLLESSEVSSLDFVAPDEQVLHFWTDGMNALLGNQMTSKETETDMETLLSMEISLRLLDAEGVDIPQEPPAVPPPPANYNFCFQFN